MSKLDESRTDTTRDDFETPEKVLVRVREVFGGMIDLDPCTKMSNPTGAMFIETHEGLDDWALEYGQNAFVNPPYGHALKPWIKHCIRQADRGFNIITLTPARPDTVWYDLLANNCEFLAQIRGRLVFNLDGAPVRVLDKKTGKMKISPAQFPCTLGILTSDAKLAVRFADVMRRDDFARIERVYKRAA
jgi:hypothetical protein